MTEVKEFQKAVRELQEKQSRLLKCKLSLMEFFEGGAFCSAGSQRLGGFLMLGVG